MKTMKWLGKEVDSFVCFFFLFFLSLILLSPPLPGLFTHDVSPENIEYVVCTNGHSDKVGNLNLFVHAIQIVSHDICVGDQYVLHQFKEVMSWAWMLHGDTLKFRCLTSFLEMHPFNVSSHFSLSFFFPSFCSTLLASFTNMFLFKKIFYFLNQVLFIENGWVSSLFKKFRKVLGPSHFSQKWYFKYQALVY